MSKHEFIQQPILSTSEDLHWHNPFPGEQIALRIDSRETGGRLGMGEAIVQPMVGPPLHIHHDADEIIYVLEGTVDFELDGQRMRTGPGGFVLIPRGTPHTFRNLGALPARLLGVFTPGGLERLFQEMDGRPLEDFPKIAAGFSVEIVGPQLEPVG